MKRLVLLLCFWSCFVNAQHELAGTLYGKEAEIPAFAQLGIRNTTCIALANAKGAFTISGVPAGRQELVIQCSGFITRTISITVPCPVLSIPMAREADLQEVVVTGTLKEINKDDSPVNIDIITPRLFQKTATPNLFEATGMVNGVKPQINCNVCNTGDIHINGMEGPYTLILIDGMPIVSGLSSVYGLMGIPASMIERLEIAKGPAGALYGSEAMGGTINLITKNPSAAPKVYADYFGTTYLENNLDLAFKFRPQPQLNWLLGANAYWYDQTRDINQDGFTDVTLQKRISVFNKISVERKNEREFSLAARYVYEDRWGGQTNWNKNFRGGDSVYGESIYANRVELIGRYQWPGAQKIFTQVSYNLHDQNSVYGRVPFIARQSTAFTQTYWLHELTERSSLTSGITYKHLWYDDNTGATGAIGNNSPDNTSTLGAFVQHEINLDSLSHHKLLSGVRLDYNNVYHAIPSPRLAYKWTPNYRFTARLNFASGFRIVNVFTEDHAALTGARTVVFEEKIRPEQSLNGSLNVVWKMKASRAGMLVWDGTIFYYHFTNKIYANYDVDPNKVIYRNLDGYAFSRGISLNLNFANPSPFKISAGLTYADVQNGGRDSAGRLVFARQLNAPAWSGNVIAGYNFSRQGLKADVTANWFGPQRLPILPGDYRPEYSPWYCLLNVQLSKQLGQRTELYAGVKNLLNFLPSDPIMRPHDPFDKRVLDVQDNPNGYTFDPSYSYAPMQGIRGYLGLRMTLK